MGLHLFVRTCLKDNTSICVFLPIYYRSCKLYIIANILDVFFLPFKQSLDAFQCSVKINLHSFSKR